MKRWQRVGLQTASAVFAAEIAFCTGCWLSRVTELGAVGEYGKAPHNWGVLAVWLLPCVLVAGPFVALIVNRFFRSEGAYLAGAVVSLLTLAAGLIPLAVYLVRIQWPTYAGSERLFERGDEGFAFMQLAFYVSPLGLMLVVLVGGFEFWLIDTFDKKLAISRSREAVSLSNGESPRIF